jgi:hypothetical protein
MESENILEITDPAIEIPGDIMSVLNFMNHITGNMHRKFKDMSTSTVSLHEENLALIHRQLVALIRYTNDMCDRFQQIPIEHFNRSPTLQPQSSMASELPRLVRSSYKFCENSASCKLGTKCRQHHFVFNRLYGDLVSLQNYILEYPQSWNLAEATRSINTIYFVVSHMHHEHHARQTVGVFNRAIATSNTLQNPVAPAPVEEELDADWKKVISRRRKN